MSSGSRIRELRNAAGMSQDALAKQTGYTSRSSIAKIEKDLVDLPSSKIKLFAEALNTSQEYLLGLLDPNTTEETVAIPVIGEIAAGYTMDVREEYDETIEIPVSWLHGRPKTDYFIVRVSGDSMCPDYQDGDLVLVLRQITMNHSGQIGAVIFDDTHVTLKRIEYVMGEDWMRLVPINTQFPPIMVTGERLEHCHVLGPVKMVIRTVRQ